MKLDGPKIDSWRIKRPIVEWIISHFLLQKCQKKHNEWSYDILKEFIAKWLVSRKCELGLQKSSYLGVMCVEKIWLRKGVKRNFIDSLILGWLIRNCCLLQALAMVWCTWTTNMLWFMLVHCNAGVQCHYQIMENPAKT